MNMYVVITIISVWLVFNLTLKLANKKKADYSFIVTFVYILGFAYFFFYDLMDSNEYMYYTYALIGTFILVLIIKVLRSVFKRDISELDYRNLENEISEINSASELLRKRFISTIEILNDGLCFKDEGEDFFGTDKFIEFFGLKSNVFSKEMLENMIYKDDLPQYKNILEKLSKKRPVYTTTYRVINEGKIIWIKEVGRKIFLDKKE